MTSAQQYAQIGLSHLGEPGPDNTCLSNGVQRWAKEGGLPQLGNNTATVSVYRKAAKDAGYYHTDITQIQVGDVLDWAFINGIIGHVSVCTKVTGGMVTSVASGTSKGVISLSTIPFGAIQGFIRLPFGGEQSLVVDNNPNPQTTTQTSGASGIFPSLTAIAENVAQPGFWVRAGIMTLGIALLGVAVIKLVSMTDAGQKAISATKTAVKGAAEAAALA